MSEAFLAADTSELLMVIMAILSCVVIGWVWILRREDGGWVHWNWVAALVPPLIARSCIGWDNGESLGLLFLESWVAGMVCYGVMRRRVPGHTPGVAWAGAVINSILPFLLAILLAHVWRDSTPLREHGPWFLLLVPMTLISMAGVLLGAGGVRRFVRSGDACAETVPANDQERQMVLDMLRSGKVTGEQAAELLKALGGARPADRQPLTRSVLGSITGSLLVVVGFMLPWAYVHVNMPMLGRSDGYQAGYHVGFFGWIILILGVLPALFVCIPALDRHLRQGLLRIVIACTGGAFVVPLLIRSPKGIGLWVALAGFAVHVLTAVRPAGLLGGPAPR